MPFRFAAFFLLGIAVAIPAELTYQKPAKEIVDVLNAPPPPLISVSPSREYAILMQPLRYPPIAEVARPMLRLAGLRIDIQTNGPHLPPYNTSYTIKRLSDASDTPVSTPAHAKLGRPLWSPDGKQFAFTDTTDTAIELWIGTTANGQTRRVPGLRLNAVMGQPVVWLSDNRTLLVRLVPEHRGQPPAQSIVPSGPHMQESSGRSGPVVTFEDMLSTPHDEDLFDYYAAAQLAYVDAAPGKITPVSKPEIFEAAEPSPDGQYLLVSQVHRPYSYLHPVFRFPQAIEVWDRAGQKLYQLADLPLADRIPVQGVRTGPRGYEWRADRPASLVWVEALDGGNPKEKVPHRDRILSLAAPFQSEPREVFQTVERFVGLEELAQNGKALVSDYDRDKRWERTIEIHLDAHDADGRVIFSRNVQDRYHDPGNPVMHILPNGQEAILQKGDNIFLTAAGSSPSGDHPFLDRYNLATEKSERLFQSGNGSYETVVSILDDNGARLLTRRESPAEPPNYYIREGDALTPLTKLADPTPQVRGIRKQIVTYQREDGVPLSFTLYLPPGYKEGTRLPTVLWAYPLEYNDANTAGQVNGSTDRFTVFTGPSLHLLFLLRGYSVLDDAAMPVIGDPETVNNTYVQQIVMDAKAAIDKAVEMGVTDRERVGVGGHSYGAFMTANLLAHSDLFHAGVAESGAYNRTLTPFGFQTERRSLWEAQDIYLRMSPFMIADKIKTPILLIHGEADNNTGTFPIQSERLYQAIRGNGGTVRLVMLPLESHGYAARESIEHVLWEEMNWFDKYLKKP
ncbi:MAG TPA: prolyl oligopeptidase family serine peptidase [Bryobacteraceae bacterium]|nr:prolyl oligopeptidase family serine peptidase [Bryobacteraceae bacterium]